MTEQPKALRLAEMNENKGNRLQPFIEDNEFTEFGYRPEGLRQEQSDMFASAAELRRLYEVEGRYHELLYAVGNKYEGESRHQTALRHIQQAEVINSVAKEKL